MMILEKKKSIPWQTKNAEVPQEAYFFALNFIDFAISVVIRILKVNKNNNFVKWDFLLIFNHYEPLCNPVNYGLYPFFLVYTTLTTIRRRQRVQERELREKDNAHDIRDQFLVKNDVVMAAPW